MARNVTNNDTHIDIADDDTMTKLIAPNAIVVKTSRCEALTQIDAPKAQQVIANDCDALEPDAVNAPAARKVVFNPPRE